MTAHRIIRFTPSIHLRAPVRLWACSCRPTVGVADPSLILCAGRDPDVHLLGLAL